MYDYLEFKTNKKERKNKKEFQFIPINIDDKMSDFLNK